jgi:hypothetical protein
MAATLTFVPCQRDFGHNIRINHTPEGSDVNGYIAGQLPEVYTVRECSLC